MGTPDWSFVSINCCKHALRWYWQFGHKLGKEIFRKNQIVTNKITQFIYDEFRMPVLPVLNLKQLLWIGWAKWLVYRRVFIFERTPRWWLHTNIRQWINVYGRSQCQVEKISYDKIDRAAQALWWWQNNLQFCRFYWSCSYTKYDWMF